MVHLHLHLHLHLHHLLNMTVTVTPLSRTVITNETASPVRNKLRSWTGHDLAVHLHLHHRAVATVTVSLILAVLATPQENDYKSYIRFLD